MPPTSDSISLDRLLVEQIACAEAMLETLGAEDSALRHGDMRSLSEAGARKADLIDNLEALEQQRLSLDPSKEQVSPATRSHWHRLLELLERCRRHNQRNGVLLSARRARVVETLRVLRGQELATYDAGGTSRSAQHSSHLGRA